MAISNRDLDGLKHQNFDIVIIGGGISGAWLTLHCTQQGHKTALIEKHDYASQTSSSSSKLLHGGIRYLQQMQFNKVRESAMERAHYVYAAPHLSTPVPFVVPTYRDFQRSKFFLNCGMRVYQALCFNENALIDSLEQNLPSPHSLSAPELNNICDLSHDNHTGAVVFYERHMRDSERMVLAILQTAKKLGAQVHNYVSATGFHINENTVCGIHLKDELSQECFTINSKLVINATGPWIDKLNSMLTGAREAPSINGFAVGSHIITRQLCDHAVALTTQYQSNAKVGRGGRHVFIIPWRGYSLIGTSYDEMDNPDGDIRIQPSHVDQLLNAVNEGMPNAKLTRADLISGYSGLYPLQTHNIQRTVYQGSGEYQIIDHAHTNNVNGIITALGAKFTTGRKLSELTMKLVSKKLGGSDKLKRVKLIGSHYSSLSQFIAKKKTEYANQLPETTIEHLIMHYGSEFDTFVASLGDPLLHKLLHKKICPHQPDIMGQVAWAVKHEQAITLDDILFNRTSLGLLGIQEDGVHAVAKLMAHLQNWTEVETQSQTTHVLQRLDATNTALKG